ncbi:hypothetical protein [Kitasatospora sp. NPDC002965]|uniref:hypothetical protein n=1 Tax=Kitasatospora sp. NPDC002965 TaxID=3154775 RepID=UPI0033A03D3E
MPTADLSLRDEYAAAVERLAGRTLDALRGVEGAVALADPGTGTAPRPVLAAARVLGPDLLAPRLLGAAGPDDEAVLLLAEALLAFPPAALPAGAASAPLSPGLPSGTAASPRHGPDGHGPDGGPDGLGPDATAVVTAWRDWAAGALLTRALASTADLARLAAPGVNLAAPQPDRVPRLEPHAWQAWSVRMAQLSSLALPDLDGPVHDAARANTLALARGAVRSMLRRDHRVAARLARWLAWAAADGRPVPLEIAPVLERIQVVGDGSARTALELSIADALLSGATP